MAKNRNGDQIKNQTIVRIRSGYREVKLFLFRVLVVRSSISIVTTSFCLIQNSIKQMDFWYKKQTIALLLPEIWKIRVEDL